MLAQERSLLGCHRFGAGRAGDDSALVLKLAEFRPKPFQRRRYFAGMLAVRQIGDDVAQARVSFRTARFGVRPGLDDEKGAGRPQREAGAVLASPNRSEFVLEVEIAKFVEHQQVLALARTAPASRWGRPDRKSTRLNSSHTVISYAV